MIGAPNSLNLNCKVRVMKEVPGPLVSEEIADFFTNYNIDSKTAKNPCEISQNLSSLITSTAAEESNKSFQ